MQGNYDKLYYGWQTATSGITIIIKKKTTPFLLLNTASKKYSIPVFLQFQVADIIN